MSRPTTVSSLCDWTRRILNGAVGVVCLLSLFGSPGRGQDLDTFFGRPVAEVRIELENRLAKRAVDDLRGFIRVREGANYSAVDIRNTLVALFESGRVSNARAESSLNEKGSVIVTFVVTPQFHVGEVGFSGLVAEVSEEELRARLVDMDRGLKFQEASMNRAADTVAEAFKDRGYYQVSVEPRPTRDEATSTVNILFAVTAGTPARIASLNLTGDARIPQSVLKLALRTKAGAVFSRAALLADEQTIQKIHLERNYFAAKIGPPDITYDNAKNEVIVDLPVNSGPVFSVRIAGAQIPSKTLRRILPMMREGGVDDATLDDSARRVRDYLQEEGYFFAEVTPPDTPDPGKPSSELLFNVNAGQRYRVTEIRIEGTDKINFTEIAPNLKTQTAAFFPIPLLTTKYIRGITSEQSLRRDADFILSQLRDQGYRKARMVSINRAVSDDNGELKIIFKVSEGPKSTIGDIAFKGNILFPEDELRKRITLDADAAYSISRVKVEANKVIQQYYDEGYASATIFARAQEMGNERVRVVYEIAEGPRYFINRIFVNETGTRHRTVTGRVRNYLRFKEGDLLNNDKVSQSEQELYAAGAFRRVQIRTEALGDETGVGDARRNVFVDVEEAKSRTLVYGGGYQSDEGPRGIFEVSDPNIFGRLTTASFRLRASPKNFLGQLSYTDPRPFNMRTPLLFSVLAQSLKRPAYDSTRLTGLLQVNKQLTDRSILLFRYNYEAITVGPPSLSSAASTDAVIAQLDRRDQPIRLSRLSVSYAYDGRNNPFDATTGRYHTADVTVALRALGGNGQFVRLFTENQLYKQLPGKKSPLFASNLRLGMAANIGQPAEKILPPTNLRTELDNQLIPLTERFFSGGSTTLRGYNFELAGPHQCVVTAVANPVANDSRIGKDCSLVSPAEIKGTSDQIIGGNALLVMNAELRQPLYRQISVVGFYDAGNVFTTVQQMKFSNFTHSVGLGLRIKTALGPIRLDMGYLASDPFTGTGLRRPLDPLNPFVPYPSNPSFNAPRIRWHISFGQAF